jgi:hypothetical protein
VSWLVPPGLADEVAAQARAAALEAAASQGRVPPRRRDRLLPGRLGVYFVLGLCLYSHLPYCQVMAELSGGLGRALAAAGWSAPAATALTGLRRRLGERPFELLFWRVAGTLTPGRDPWSLVCGLLAVAWDGTTLKVPASPENAACFGRPGRRRENGQGTGKGHYPQARLVALVACGSRALIGAAAGPLGTGERKLAGGLAGCLRPGMLLLADRGFYGWALWNAAAGTGAHLLWRVQSGLHLPCVRELPDGSWLTRIDDPAAVRRRTRKNGERRRRGSRLPPDAGPLRGALTARVVQFTVTVACDDGTVRTEQYRMITTLLDHRAAPARDLAEGYARRWAAEIAFLHLKRTVRGPRRPLRGQSPELARQEAWALLLIHNITAAAAARAAGSAGTDPGLLPFTAVLALVRSHVAADTCCQHCGQRPGNLLTSLNAAILALPRHREGRQRTSGRTPAERRTRHTEEVTYTIDITKSNLPEWDTTPET